MHTYFVRMNAMKDGDRYTHYETVEAKDWNDAEVKAVVAAAVKGFERMQPYMIKDKGAAI
jgi:hypothetical protein